MGGDRVVARAVDRRSSRAAAPARKAERGGGGKADSSSSETRSRQAFGEPAAGPVGQAERARPGAVRQARVCAQRTSSEARGACSEARRAGAEACSTFVASARAEDPREASAGARVAFAS
jgi:hypothetical protein